MDVLEIPVIYFVLFTSTCLTVLFFCYVVFWKR